MRRAPGVHICELLPYTARQMSSVNLVAVAVDHGSAVSGPSLGERLTVAAGGGG